MENFFGILKQEIYYGYTYYSFEELKGAIDKFIKYYNYDRIKEKLGWLSPSNLGPVLLTWIQTTKANNSRISICFALL